MAHYECTSCTNVSCQSSTHIEGIDRYTLDILEAMEKSGLECLPIRKNSNKSRNSIIPGWNEHIKPYADEAQFWQQLWLSAGKPIGDGLYLNMKISIKLKNIFY